MIHDTLILMAKNAVIISTGHPVHDDCWSRYEAGEFTEEYQDWLANEPEEQ
jgi:hypothetical protein